MRSYTPIVLFVVFLLVAPYATAQGPGVPAPTPVYTLVLSGAPAEFTGLTGANATANAPVRVELRLGNVVCAEPATIPVTVTATPANPPGYFSLIVEPSVVNVTITQGPHGNEPVGSAAAGAGDVVVRAIIRGNITTNASVAVTIAASAPAPSQCQGAGEVPSAASDPLTVFANMTAPPPPPVETAPTEDTPFVGLLAVAGVAVAVALGRRRKA